MHGRAERGRLQGEEYDMIAMTWRSLKARMDDKTLNMKRAVWTWARLTLSRFKAYGSKRYKWYVGQRLWHNRKRQSLYRNNTECTYSSSLDHMGTTTSRRN